ncbi:MAG: ABC transporter substrate-binding protein [Solirubrobacterales bacterium]
MRKTRLWALLAALVLAMTATLAVGCGDDDDDEGNGGGGGQPELIQEGQLLVGTDTPFPPFEIGQPPDISGYDIEVLNEVGKRLNLEVTYRDTSFDTIFTDLANGRFDIVAAASTILPDREQTVDFSDPYYLTPQSLLVEAGNTDISTAEDLGGATVGAQDGTTGEFYAQDETDASTVRGYPEGPDAINALRAGQIDAVIIDSAVAEDAVQKTEGIEIAQKIVTNELYGFPVAEDNDALREQVNGALAEMKEDGTLARLYQKYFKEDPPQEVLEGTHEPQ